MNNQTQSYQLVNDKLPEGTEIIFLAEGLSEATNIVKQYFPQYYYGCNIIGLDSEEFKLIPSRRYYEDIHKEFGTPMPV